MIKLLQSGKRVINVDESWVNQTQYHRRMWAPSDSPASATARLIAPRLSLIAALDSDGRVFFALLHANTDTNVFMMFLGGLFKALDAELPDWRETSVLMLDGAKYHTNEECIHFLRISEVQTIFSGPYSYCKYNSSTGRLLILTLSIPSAATAPIELLFGSFKLGDLCGFNHGLGKK